MSVKAFGFPACRVQQFNAILSESPLLRVVKICENDNSIMMYGFGEFRLSSTTRTLWRSGVEVPLTGRECDTLLALLRQPGMAVSRQALSEAVWSDTSVTANNLSQQIAALRRKLGRQADGAEFIRTIPNRGYQFAAAVITWSEDQPQTVPVAAPLTAASPARNSSRRFLLSGIALLVFAVVVLFVLGPLPKEVVVTEYRQITRDGLRKHGGVFADGRNVYFNEFRDGLSVIASAPISGGLVTVLPVGQAEAIGIAPDRRSLLIRRVEQLYQLDLDTLDTRAIPLPDNALAIAADWDPANRRLAVSTPSTLFVLDPFHPRKAPQFKFEGSTDFSNWEPRSHTLRFAVLDHEHETSQWWEVDEDVREPRRFGSFSQNPIERHGSWSSDRRFFVFEAGKAERTQIWAEDLGSVPNRAYKLTADSRIWRNPSFVPNSTSIVAASSESQGRLVRLPNSGDGSQNSWLLPGVPAYELDYSHDGQWIAYTLFPDQTIWRCRKDGSEPKQLTASGVEAHQPHWSPDGTRIAFMGKKPGNQSPWRIYIVPSSGGEMLEPHPNGAGQGVPTWYRHGKSIVYGDLKTSARPESVRIHEMDLHTGAIRDLDGAAGMWSPRVSPDGQRLAAISFDNRGLYLRDADSNSWRMCVNMDFLAEPIWNQDSASIQFLGVPESHKHVLFRTDRDCRQVTRILDVTSYEFIGADWFGIAPDGAPTGLTHVPDEIYAIQWHLQRRIGSIASR